MRVATLLTLLFFALTSLPAHSHAPGAVNRPRVTLPTGAIVTGVSLAPPPPADTAVTIDAFLGLRFAEPPLGDLRFRSPVPHSYRGNETVDASSFGEKCPQRSLLNPMAGTQGSEDCLFVNVWAPRATTANSDNLADRNLPVLVWVYGGGFTTGDSSFADYDPLRLIDTSGGGMVFVSFNYRLGPLGFFPGGDLDASLGGGMQGIEDQALALAWVRRNIGAFGGNPTRITVQGESAGSVSASILAVSPLSRGMASGFFMESSSCDAVAPDQSAVKSSVSMLAERLGCTGSEANRATNNADVKGPVFHRRAGKNVRAESNAETDVASCLRAASADDIIAAAADIGALTLFAPNQFTAAVDGRVLPKPCIEMFMDGDFETGANFVVGSNHDEMSLFLSLKPAWMGVNATTLPGLVKATTGDDAPLVRYYTDLDRFGGLPISALIRALSEGKMICSMRRLAKLTAGFGRGRTYLYSFNHAPKKGVFRGSPIFGAAHYFDVPYWFGTAPSVGDVIGAFEPDEEALSLRMRRFLSAFAMIGNPSAPIQFSDRTIPKGKTTRGAEKNPTEVSYFPTYEGVSNLTLNLDTSGATAERNRYETPCDMWDRAAVSRVGGRYVGWAQGREDDGKGNGTANGDGNAGNASQQATKNTRLATAALIVGIASGVAAIAALGFAISAKREARAARENEGSHRLLA